MFVVSDLIFRQTLLIMQMMLDVFNTEAHPFKLSTVPADQKFGTGKLRPQDQPSQTVPGDLPQVSKVPKAPLLGLIALAGNILSS
jgi:hypothetical protein